MAQGNPFNGMLKGRIGDTVFSRKRGVQQSRAYRRDPYNPQTTAQNGQRVKFGSASRFYARGVKNLFKFAYEYKRPGESDYNAFLRYNLKNAIPETREAYNDGAPCIGNWIMADGSLPSIQPEMEPDEMLGFLPGLYTGVNFGEGCDNTLGALSRALIEWYGIQDGDYFTIVYINANVNAVDYIDAAKEVGALTYYDPSVLPTWVVKQFRLDVNSAMPIADMGIFGFCSTAHNYLTLPFAQVVNDDVAASCAFIISRRERRGVKVSRAELVHTMITRAACEIGATEEWWKFCAQNFNATNSLENVPVDILEGSIAENTQESPVVVSAGLPLAVPVNGTTKPADQLSAISAVATDFSLRSMRFVTDKGVVKFAAMEIYDSVRYYRYGDTDSVASFWVTQSGTGLYGTARGSGTKLTGVFQVVPKQV